MARCAKSPLKRLFHALASHDHQPEVIKRKDLGWRFIVTQSVLQRLHYSRAIPPFLHVDQIQHDDAAQIAQPNLSDNLVYSLEIRARYCIFQTSTATADELSRVDVNRHQSFRLIDDEVAARLEPNTGLDRLIDLGLHATAFQDRLVARIKLDALHHAWIDAINKLDDALVFLF